MTILSRGTNPKTLKSDKLGQYLTGILYMSPGKLSGKNFCPYATPGCLSACLNTAGRGRMSNVQKGRLRKSMLFVNNKAAFFNELIKDIEKLIRDCDKQGKLPAVRLNGTSDIRWEKLKFEGQTIIDRFPNVQFYDYTKNPHRFKDLPANYHLTYSYNEETDPQTVQDILASGGNVAMVFRKDIPHHYCDSRKINHNSAYGVSFLAGLAAYHDVAEEVVNGDLHDLRFLDPKGRLVALTAKGDAKKDRTGFVLDYSPTLYGQSRYIY